MVMPYCWLGRSAAGSSAVTVPRAPTARRAVALLLAGLHGARLSYGSGTLLLGAHRDLMVSVASITIGLLLALCGRRPGRFGARCRPPAARLADSLQVTLALDPHVGQSAPRLARSGEASCPGVVDGRTVTAHLGVFGRRRTCSGRRSSIGPGDDVVAVFAVHHPRSSRPRLYRLAAVRPRSAGTLLAFHCSRNFARPAEHGARASRARTMDQCARRAVDAGRLSSTRRTLPMLALQAVRTSSTSRCRRRLRSCRVQPAGGVRRLDRGLLDISAAARAWLLPLPISSSSTSTACRGRPGGRPGFALAPPRRAHSRPGFQDHLADGTDVLLCFSVLIHAVQRSPG